MKESNFYSDEFEQLIREKTEQYKMYPSENVWKAVHNSLHTKRRWFIGSMAFLVTGILFFSGRELLAPGHPLSHKIASAGPAAADGLNGDPARSGQAEENPHGIFVSPHPGNPAAVTGHRQGAAGNIGWEPEEVDQPANHLAITISHPVVSQPDLSELLSHAVRLPGEAPSLLDATGTPLTAITKAPENPSGEPGLLDSWLVRNAPGNSAAHRDIPAVHNNAETLREPVENTRETAEPAGSKESEKEIADDAPRSRTYGQIDRNSATRQGSFTGKIKEKSDAAKASTEAIGEASDLSRVNWLHDYAVYSLPPNPGRGRFFFQLVLAPTVNYRSLSGGSLPSSKQLTGPISTIRAGDVQSWADQSPALGFEFGANLLYRVTRNLTLKGGLQFNYSHYKMLAYTTPNQPVQTAGYRTPLGNAYFIDSMASVAPSAVNNPYTPSSVQATLYNDYYQLSAPLGFDLRVLGNERLQFSIGATIQPSYLLNTNSYILSSDYTSYTKEPTAFRRWNLSGGVEAFLSYQTGLVRWQIGPEFRYQLFSNYLSNNPYPISENLKGYGLRIGITKPLP
ncbi:MAG TPA: hypothetical protein VMH27_15620 [Puia sp.]|nr:hypothetical protein [Puia sp.]